MPTPDSFAGFSADDYQPKKPKWPILVCGVVAVALVAGGAWYFLSNQGSITEPGTPSVQYPENTAGVDEQQQAMQDVLQSAKEQRVPSMTQLVDLIAINKLAGTLESEGDGKNANVVATLPTESLAQKATEFKESTNEDTIGWIQLPNTNVDYPVVYKAGSENYDYYGSLDYNKITAKTAQFLPITNAASQSFLRTPLFMVITGIMSTLQEPWKICRVTIPCSLWS